jgi:hypothetical protein
MNWKHYLPLLMATVLIVATQIICTYALVREQRRSSVDSIDKMVSASTRNWTFDKVGGSR